MKNKNFKSIILTVILIVSTLILSGCASSESKAVKSVEVEKTPESSYETYIGKKFSQIESELGELNYEYYWEGGDHYSASGTDYVFAFPSYNITDELMCTAISAPLKSMFPDLAAKADKTGFVTAEQLSDYFESTYTYQYDDIHNLDYSGAAYKDGILTNENYVFFFFPESDGSCGVDTSVMVKVSNN